MTNPDVNLSVGAVALNRFVLLGLVHRIIYFIILLFYFSIILSSVSIMYEYSTFLIYIIIYHIPSNSLFVIFPDDVAIMIVN